LAEGLGRDSVVFGRDPRTLKLIPPLTLVATVPANAKNCSFGISPAPGNHH
jgi:hypothetical protein